MKCQNRSTLFLSSSCCAEKPAKEMKQLACRHSHCLTCWQDYLESRIDQNGCGQGLLCPSRCNQVADDETILEILTNNESLRRRYQHYLLETYVASNRLTKWCPGNNCNTIVKMRSYTPKCSQMIECDHCKTTFCFNCGKQWHEPAPCFLLQKWEIKNQDESMTGKWLLASE